MGLFQQSCTSYGKTALSCFDSPRCCVLRGTGADVVTYYGDLTPRSSSTAESADPWITFVPYAWQLLADAASGNPVPACPTHRGTGPDNPQIAWWSPLLHLLVFGLGWSRPDVGLARWFCAGRSVEDGILELVNCWWGDRTEHVLAWAGHSPMLKRFGADVHHAVAGTQYDDTPFQDLWGRCRDTENYQRSFGDDGDSMHLTYHCDLPINYDGQNPAPHRLFTQSADSQSRHIVLVVAQYSGWYRTLSTVAPRQTSDGRSYRVDVFCTTVGFLGTYRCSRDTGRWFRGQHRSHILGAMP